MKTCKLYNFFNLVCVWLKGVGVWLAAAGIFVCGCENPGMQDAGVSPQQGFNIQRVRISALTDFVVSGQDLQQNEIKTYTELLDAYDTSFKKPCVFRFELYEYKPLTSNPRGKRIIIWPDIDLSSAGKNNEHWKDYLRAYEFYLPLGFSPQAGRDYLLEATCLVGERRFSDLFKIQYRP